MKRLASLHRSPADRSDLSLHFVYSYECGLLCAHCLYRCGPGPLPCMGKQRAAGYIDQASRAGIGHIVFNGGEPFLHFPDLCSLIAHANEQGIRCTVMTSGSWAVSEKRAVELLCELRRSGLHSISLSADRYHLVFVRQQNICHALNAARKLGIRAGVKITRLPWDPVAEGLFRSIQPLTERIFVQEVSPLGRAASLRDRLLLRPVFQLNRPGCSTPPVLLPDGSLLTCCNLPARDMDPRSTPFLLGSLECDPLEQLLALRTGDPLLRTLRQKGPLGLYIPVLASAPENAPVLPSLYHDGCDLCFHLFRNRWARDQARTFLGRTGIRKRRDAAPEGRLPRLRASPPAPASCGPANENPVPLRSAP
jgi:hypothetical protein